MILLQAQFR